jgi:hypothetical protein
MNIYFEVAQHHARRAFEDMANRDWHWNMAMIYLKAYYDRRNG